MGSNYDGPGKNNKGGSFLAVIFPMLFLGAGCVSTGEIKPSAPIFKIIKMIGDLLDRLQ